MSKRLKRVAAAFVLVLAAAQLVRPDRTNPPTDARRTIEARLGTANGLAAILDRACNDYHSNSTVWPWYTQIAPLSWLMAYAVKEGRNTVNFSAWDVYPAARQ